MRQYIDKSILVEEIVRRIKYDEIVMNHDTQITELLSRELNTLYELLSFIKSFEVKDLDKEKTKWSPSKKQMESLRDMLKYNIGEFDYQKFMEVNSLYNNLTKIFDYEIDRQK